MTDTGNNNNPPPGPEQQLQQLRAELEASNRALEAFAYSVSHDLRAPLRKIGYFTELLLETYEGKLDDKGIEWLSKLGGQAREMAHLIDALIELSRTGRKTPHKTAVPMQDIVKDLTRHAGSHAAHRIIRFTIHPVPAAPADRDLISQVWTQLISNAVKYTARKEETLIEIGAETKPGSIIYYIKDNGVGFDMHYADKLFSPFQRLHNRSDFEGIGIGLAMAERIIARHNGKIWVEAEPDKGACFYFELPI
jgi:light-regulated signal transduction histidine kinase (bacteriophytochrome)